MQEKRGSITTPDGLNLVHQSWWPDDAPRGLIVLSHGINEHSGRYKTWAQALVAANYAVFAVNHRGHGHSEGVRASVDKFSTFAADLALFVDDARGEAPGVPLFVYGHSLGGLIAVLYALEHQGEIDGLILSAPALGIPPNISPVTIRLGRLVAKIAPNLGVAKLQLGEISRDPEIVAAYDHDPLVYHGKVRARLGSSTYDAILSARSRISEIATPTLIIQGTGDSIIPPEVGPWVYENISSHDKTLQMYDGLYHEVHNEPEKDAVLRDVVTWLNAHVRAAVTR